MRVLCTICARGGSKGLKNKNIKLLNNKPLIFYTIDHAKKSKLFDKIVVSTDSKKIQKISKKYGAQCWFLRNAHLSGGNVSKVKVIRDTLNRTENKYNLKFDYIVDLDITSPLRKISDIKKAFKNFLKKKSLNLFSVCRSNKNPYFNMIEKKNGNFKLVKKQKEYFSRQKLPITYDLNASFYIWKREALIKKNALINKNSSVYIMPKSRSYDIDDYTDFKIVSYLMKNR